MNKAEKFYKLLDKFDKTIKDIRENPKDYPCITMWATFKRLARECKELEV